MSRIVTYILVFCLAVVLALPPRTVSGLEPQQPGRLERTRGIVVLHVQGNPYEMGLQQGALLRSELRTLIRGYLYGRLIVDNNLSHFWSLSQARLLEPHIPDSLRQEMQGIADGAGISYQEVLLLNTVPDLRALARKAPSSQLFPALFAGDAEGGSTTWASLCAAFAGWGRATAEGRLLVGHNLEYADSDLLRHYITLTVRWPEQGSSSVALGLMGVVGVWTGMNEEEVVVALSSSPSADVAASGRPLPWLLRQVLEGCGSVDEAVSVLLSAERLCGGNVILGDGKAPQGVALELSAHRHALFQADAASDLVLRTNHFLDTDLALTQQRVVPVEEMAASKARMGRWQEVLESNQGWIGIDKALTLLSNVGGASPDGTENAGALQTVLLEPGRLTLWVRQRDADVAIPASYIQLDLASDLLPGQ